MRTQFIAWSAVLLVSGPVAAATPRGYLDLYYIPSAKIEESAPGFGSADDTGSGFGVKGMAPASDVLVFTGEYQAVDYDGGGNLDQMRVGAGVMGRRGGGLFVEYISMDDAVEADGLGLHLRFGDRTFYGQIGYVSLQDDFEDNNGLELAAGFSARLGGNLGAFFDVRHTALESEDSGIEVELTDFRAGLRFIFPR
ncbi:MAG: hypothetical protein ACREE7_08455 [Dongiaceae bacterium]